MYAGFYENPEDGVGNVAIDVGRDDYFEHGRADCLDTAHSPFWERVGAGRAASGAAAGFHFEVGPGDCRFAAVSIDPASRRRPAGGPDAPSGP